MPAFPLSLPAGIGLVAVGGPSLVTIAAAARSPFTAQSQVYEWAQYWQIGLELRTTTMSETRRLQAFLAAMRGRVGTVLLGPLTYPKPRGTAETASVVTASGSSGRTLALMGIGAGKTLLAGDFLQLGTGSAARLHQVVTDAAADGFGAITLEIEPRLRAAPAAGTPVTLLAPKGVFRCTNDAPGVQEQGGGGSVGLTFEEVV